MKPVVIDTNAFLRLLLNDIPKQADQVEGLIRQAQVKKLIIIVPQIIIFEIDFILSKYYKFGKDEVIGKLQALLSASYFVIELRSILQSALLFYSKNSVSFVDCFLLCQAQEERFELFTFDKRMKKLFQVSAKLVFSFWFVLLFFHGRG